MRWLIDTDAFIEGERGDPAFVPWLETQEEVATADVVRCEVRGKTAVRLPLTDSPPIASAGNAATLRTVFPKPAPNRNVPLRRNNTCTLANALAECFSELSIDSLPAWMAEAPGSEWEWNCRDESGLQHLLRRELPPAA
jgi:hypothetical protein